VVLVFAGQNLSDHVFQRLGTLMDWIKRAGNGSFAQAHFATS
jgi:hypothetical protein